jgi:hypothetical protein
MNHDYVNRSAVTAMGEKRPESVEMPVAEWFDLVPIAAYDEPFGRSAVLSGDAFL